MGDAVTPTSTFLQPMRAVLHQSLHGYSDGHRLLEASVSLPDDQSRVMLRMSDLSGSSASSGFEEYITGYPLHFIDSYALARTWHAPEMPRPGCVWTHSLIIPRAEMARIGDLNSLKLLFRRPLRNTAPNTYTSPLVLHDAAKARPPSTDSREKRALYTLYYGQEQPPLLFSSKDAAEFEEILLDLWSQQWPALRMSFLFCTGSLAARSLSNRSFEIQCVPTSQVRDVSLEISAAGPAKPIVINSYSGEIPVWADIATNDTLAGSGQLRQFLCAVSDETVTRKDFSRLVTIYSRLAEPPTASALIHEIAEAFPDESVATRLKSVLLRHSPELVPTHNIGELELLTSLATATEYRAFNPASLSVRERSVELCNAQPEAARDLIGLLFRSTLSPLGEEILDGAISALSPVVAGQVTRDQPQCLPALFSAKPNLAAAPELWRAAGDRKRELFESVAAHDSLNDRLVADISRALLESAADSLIRPALDKWSKPAVFGMLDWVAEHNGTMSEACYRAMTFHVHAVMDWVEAAERPLHTLVAIAHIIAPYSYSLAQRQTGVWLQSLRTLRRSGDNSEEPFLSAFLLTLALRNAPPSPLDAISECFERVHTALANDALSEAAWTVLDQVVPRLYWARNWDRCERLRRGLIEAFVRNRWPRSLLGKCVSDPTLVKWLYYSAHSVEGWDTNR